MTHAYQELEEEEFREMERAGIREREREREREGRENNYVALGFHVVIEEAFFLVIEFFSF